VETLDVIETPLQRGRRHESNLHRRFMDFSPRGGVRVTAAAPIFARFGPDVGRIDGS
jgi:hypothetical protein